MDGLGQLWPAHLSAAFAPSPGTQTAEPVQDHPESHLDDSGQFGLTELDQIDYHAQTLSGPPITPSASDQPTVMPSTTEHLAPTNQPPISYNPPWTNVSSVPTTEVNSSLHYHSLFTIGASQANSNSRSYSASTSMSEPMAPPPANVTKRARRVSRAPVAESPTPITPKQPFKEMHADSHSRGGSSHFGKTWDNAEKQMIIDWVIGHEALPERLSVAMKTQRSPRINTILDQMWDD
ncbi:hypothetical protein FRC10_000788, partial [Ceratobasidium sp. 414]